MKTGKFGIVAVMTLAAGAVPALAIEDQRPVLIGSDGSLRFDHPSTPVEYVATGLWATPEAMEYPGKVKQLIAEGLNFLPVKTKIVDHRMVGFVTWRITRESGLVLARSAEGLLEVRPPAGEAETRREEKEETNSFGVLAAICLTLLLLGNLLVKTAPVAAAVAAAAIVVIAFTAVESVRSYRIYSAATTVLMTIAVLAAIYG